MGKSGSEPFRQLTVRFHLLATGGTRFQVSTHRRILLQAEGFQQHLFVCQATHKHHSSIGVLRSIDFATFRHARFNRAYIPDRDISNSSAVL